MMHSIKPFLCLGFPKTTRLSPAISPLVWSDVYFCTRQKELDTRFDFMFLSIKSFINYIPNQTPSPSIIFNFIFYHSHITFSQLQHVKKPRITRLVPLFKIFMIQLRKFFRFYAALWICIDWKICVRIHPL